MKILYGVQGTGNGHLTRSRVMAKHFAETYADVDYLLSGRERDQYFDMGAFGDFEVRRGLTFTTKGGRIQYFRTLLDNNVLQFWRDVRQLDVSAYDLIITDFEPVTAWAGKLAGKPVMGIGHQYAFDHDIPTAGENPVAKLIMKVFAPVQQGIGLHWHHFDNPILPPIIDHGHERTQVEDDLYVVYLPFEDQTKVTELLKKFSNYRFLQYAPGLTDSEAVNVSLRKTCLEGFKDDLGRASGVICNAGFELVSECLQVGIPVLVKPLAGQMEQLSNAAALQQLNYGNSMQRLDVQAIEHWLASPKSGQAMNYPNVARALVDWILNDQQGGVSLLTDHLWAAPTQT